MTTLQVQARALGDPTRHAIFRLLAGTGAPLGVADINEHFALNHNAVRQHLGKLVAAGLVLESTAEPIGRGRPRLVYVVNPAGEGAWGTPGPYERLSRLLVEVIRTGGDPREVGRRALHEHRVPSPTSDAVAHVYAAMARQGFEPEIRPTRAGTDIVLHRCPFESAAHAGRDTVCSLHLGMAEGLTDGTSVVVEELVANDPSKAECRIRLGSAGEGAEAPGGKLSLRRRT